MRSVALCLLSGYVLGLWLGSCLGWSQGLLFLVFSPPLLGSLGYLLLGRSRRSQGAVIALAIVLASLGCVRFTLWQHALPGTLAVGAAELSGRIRGDVITTSYSTRLILAAEAPQRGQVRITLPRWNGPQLRSGDRLLVEGVLAPIGGPTNPGEADGRLYWHGKGVYWQLVQPQVLSISPVRAERWAERIQGRLTASLKGSLPDHQLGLVKALLFGDKSGLEPELYRKARQAGIAHLFAVSGLHIGMVGAAAAYLASQFVSWQAFSALVGMMAIACYALLCGPTASVVRASLMYLLGWALRPALGREALIVSLALSALVILSIWPFWLFTPGFQLSFGAVLGIVLCAEKLRGWLPNLPAGADGALATSMAVQLTTTPILAAHFGELALSGIVLNLVAMPLALAGVVGGLTVAAIGLLCSPLGHLGGYLLSVVLAALSACADWGSRLPLSGFPIRTFVAPQILCYYGALYLAFSQLNYRRWLCAFLTIGVLLWPLLPQGGGLEVIFFDVGHGDAILFRVLGGPTVLVDTGPGGSHVPANYSIIPYLHAAGVRRLDVVALTHAHDDHYGAARAIIEEFPCRLLLISSPSHTWPPDEVIEAVERTRGSIRETATGDVVRVGPLRLQVLHPPPGFIGDENDSSLVLRVDYGHWSALLTGDISAAVELLLVQGTLPLPSDLLKVAHHGSPTSSSEPFLATVAAAHAVIQSGGRFGHPAQAVLERLQNSGMRIWRTDQQGAIIVRVEGQSYRLRGFVSP